MEGTGPTPGRSKSPEAEALSEENALQRIRVSELESVAEATAAAEEGAGGGGGTGGGWAGLPSADSFLAAHHLYMGHDLAETPNRERALNDGRHGNGNGNGGNGSMGGIGTDGANALDRLAGMMNDEVAEWVVALAAEGADIGQIVEDQAESAMEITELHTIEDFKEELDSLNGQLRQSRESGQQMEEYHRE